MQTHSYTNGTSPAFAAMTATGFSVSKFEGLRKREYFAVHAPLEAVFPEDVTVGDMRKFFGEEDYHRIPNYRIKYAAALAVNWADALIEALNENKGE